MTAAKTDQYTKLTMLKALGSMRRLPPQTMKMAPISLMARQCSSDNKRPKAVIFDMGGVILPSPFQAFKETEKHYGLPAGTISRIIVNEGENGPWYRLECGKLTLEEFAKEFNQILSKEVGKDVDISGMMQNFSHYKAQPFPSMMEAIKRVKSEGLKTALLTNNWYIDEAKTKTLCPLDKSSFDVIVESCVLGYRKPHPNMYTRCLQELHVSGEESVFLDDLGFNLKAAKDFGIKTIKVASQEQAVADLEKVLGFSLTDNIPGTTSVPKHLQLNIETLETYLKSLGLEDSKPPVLRVFEHGQSNPTYFLSYGGRKMVLRKKPPGKLLPSAHAVDREFRVMSAMSKGGVPIPNMVAFCDDQSVVGTPFYLMDYITGTVYTDPRLLGFDKERKRKITKAMVTTLSKIHSVDIDKVGLSDYGKKGQYVERNFHRWAKQYENSKTHEIPAMTKLMQWIPEHFPSDEKVAVVHGDYRLDNLMYHPDSAEVLAVLDWELSTIGDPLTDLATCAIGYYLPFDCPLMPGLADEDIVSLGIPTVQELLDQYCAQSNIPPISNWDFYVAFVLFRTAAILQGVYKRAISGQASSSQGKVVGEFATTMAEIGWKIASHSSLPPNPKIKPNTTSSDMSSQKRSYSTLTSSSQRHHKTVMTSLVRQMASGTQSADNVGKMAVSVEGLSPHVQDLHKRVKEFIKVHVLPLEKRRIETYSDPKFDRWQVMPEMEEAKAKAKAAGLWNLFLPLESDPDRRYGAGLTNLEYAFLCEEMGKCMLAPEVFNCSAPDTGNMETLVKYATEEQKEKWLIPLLDGKIRSCFAMTEPAVASSDATNIESSIRREGNEYIINGRKWWTSGALDPRCKLCIFMGKTDPGTVKHRQQSMVLVPMDTPGITIVRPLTVFGYDDAPEGHAEVLFENVRVPVSNILLGEGRGFEIAQGRLGPGRIHHCMRLIGYAERSLGHMLERTLERVAFGKPLAAQGTIQQDVAKSRIEIEQCRLLVLKAAHMMDLYGNKVAAPEIAMIKVAAPSMAQTVIDRAIQAHGGAGLNHDFPMAVMFAWSRILRLADGPDEVHMRSIARHVYAKSKDQAKL